METYKDAIVKLAIKLKHYDISIFQLGFQNKTCKMFILKESQDQFSQIEAFEGYFPLNFY